MRLLTSSSENVYHSYDSGNIALAVIDYNISEERPHLPGYYLYVQTIRIVNLITENTHKSIIIMMAFFSALGTALFYLLSIKFFLRNISIILTLLVATNPLNWFYGSVTEVYSFDIAFSIFLILLLLNKKTIWLTPSLLAFGAGFRASSAIILFPLFIYFWYKYLKENKRIIPLMFAFILGLIVFIIWFIPFLKDTGGYDGLINLINNQNPVPDIGIAGNVVQMLTMGIWIFVPITILIIIRLINKKTSKLNKSFWNIILLWLVPAVSVFVLVHYTRGYWLVALAPCYLLIGLMAKTKASNYSLTFVAVIQTGYFLLMPFELSRLEIFYHPSQRTISKFEVQLDRFRSQNSLSVSHIRYIEELNKTVSEHLVGDFSYRYLLLDPTMIVYARALQPVFPEITFAELNLVRSDGYFIYKDMKQVNLAGRRELLNNSLIAGIPSFVNKLNKDFIEIVHVYENVMFYRIKPEGNEEIRRIYHKYFQKR